MSTGTLYPGAFWQICSDLHARVAYDLHREQSAKVSSGGETIVNVYAKNASPVFGRGVVIRMNSGMPAAR